MSFFTSLAFVLNVEKGYSDHPSDPGGATNLGITQRTLGKWRGRSVTEDEIKNLSKDEASKIYHANYWTPTMCEELPAGVDTLVFDMAVNAGVSRSIKLLQQALGGLAVDGVIGPRTLAKAAAADRIDLCVEYTARRINFYGGLDTFDTFGLGWSRRAARALRAALIAA